MIKINEFGYLIVNQRVLILQAKRIVVCIFVYLILFIGFAGYIFIFSSDPTLAYSLWFFMYLFYPA